MKTKSLLLLLIFVFAGLLMSTAIIAKTFPLTSSPAVPAAAGTVDIHKDKNGNTEVTIKAEHLAQPALLTPPASAYVVWFQESGQPAMNQGQFKVEKSLKSEFKTTTPMKNFDLFVTAENDPLTKFPAGVSVLKTKIQNVF
jgi:hypothetical protein